MEGRVKYYLAQQVPVTIIPVEVHAGVQVHVSGIFQFAITIRRVNNDGKDQKELTDKLNAAFQGRSFNWRLLTIPSYPTSGTEFQLSVVGSPGLKEVLGDTAFFQAEMFGLTLTENDGAPQQLQGFSTQEMPVSKAENYEGKLVVEDSKYNAAIDRLLRPEGRNRIIRGKMNLILITDRARNDDGNSPTKEKMAMYKRMLEEEILPDAVIVANNGAEVKCHRGILATQSDVFRTMFETDMQEAQTRKIEMADMSDKAVRAFLAYLYHGDLSEAEKSCAMALELLKAGHKYNVRSLERDMRNLLMSKPESWYDVDVAVKLFLFVRNLDGKWDAQKKKAVMVMKMCSGNLNNSAVVQQLFCEDPEAAIALFQYALSI